MGLKLIIIFWQYQGNYTFPLKPSASLPSRGSRFWSFNFLQFAIDEKNNSKTKVEKVFFFIFMSSNKRTLKLCEHRALKAEIVYQCMENNAWSFE
jgi:hypothetical protein